jgi:hypothetical protein
MNKILVNNGPLLQDYESLIKTLRLCSCSPLRNGGTIGLIAMLTAFRFSPNGFKIDN